MYDITRMIGKHGKNVVITSVDFWSQFLKMLKTQS